MGITYDDGRKDLPCDQLHRLFLSVGWSDGGESEALLRHFNAPFRNSTLVVSAWDGDRLVGAVRVLSDQITRSILYDLVVDPEYQNRGIGRALVQQCIARFPDSEWLVQTTKGTAPYYEKLGFSVLNDVFLRIPSKYF
ncbi:MAG: GNAT family N-acetyltransferase [Clostridia bacterium]|nr:GNAT family N-acetyltransferase [Clostridia bacterium]